MEAEPAESRLDGRRSHLWVSAVVCCPLVLAIVLLTQRPWAPILDMAMTELRVRDVGGSHTPLIGLPGRIGTFPDQGSHPGPASFYLLAPFYRIAGASAWGLELGSVVINSVALALTVWIGHRKAGLRGAVVLGAVGAVAVRGYGLNVLTHPWNPYFPVLIWLLVMVAAWAATTGDRWMSVIVVIGGSIAAQTHVPYLINAIAVVALVLATLAWQWRAADADERHAAGRPLMTAVAVGAVMWVPPLIDQLIRDPGNVRMLIRHFAAEPPEPAIGTGTAVKLFFRHLDAVSAFVDLFLHGDAFVHRSGLRHGSGALGAIVFVVWLAGVVYAWRRGHTSLNALNRVIAVTLAVGAFSMLRIFGKVWYYLTLWAWGSMLLVVLSIVWAARLAFADRGPSIRNGPVYAATGAVVVCTAMSVGAAVTHEVPEHQLSDGLRAVVPATAEALADGVGPAVGRDGRYVVFWQDAVFIGAQGVRAAQRARAARVRGRCA